MKLNFLNLFIKTHIKFMDIYNQIKINFLIVKYNNINY